MKNKIKLILLLLLLYRKNSYPYIDPSSGMPFVSSLAGLWIILIGFAGGILLLLKKLFFKHKKLIVLFITILAFIIVFMAQRKEFPKQRIIIIGLDGLDYSLIQEYMAKGLLPNFKRLSTQGAFLPLQTVWPAESNVVWTSFATGFLPLHHNITDFIMRSPENYALYLSLFDMYYQKERKIGPFKVPFPKRVIKSYRKKDAFWQIAYKNKIPVYAYFVPLAFPVSKVYGELIAGMGVPDVRGTMGTFLFYTDNFLESTQKDTGGIVVNVDIAKNTIFTYLIGPKDTTVNPSEQIKIPMQININYSKDKIEININNAKINLSSGQWSNWVEVDFKLKPFVTVKGICRFYLKSLKPNFQLYVTPISFNPKYYFLPVCYPKNLFADLASQIGLFSTRGMPYDTWPLNEKRIDYDDFLKQAKQVFDERKLIFENRALKYLNKSKSGIFFFYFEYPDVMQHIFLNFINSEKKYKNVILDVYQQLDDLIGWLLSYISKDNLLIVLSDHGFANFHTAVHINSWLRDRGYLSLKKGETSKEFFEDVDWSKTVAYSLGFGSIYINQIGREGQGIISIGPEKSRIISKIINDLESWQDNQGNKIVSNVYVSGNKLEKENKNIPDLYVGFYPGYRASWQTALGAVPETVMEKNEKAWASDHIFDPGLIPGVFFINRRLKGLEKVNIIDIIPTVFDIYNVKYNNWDGKSFKKFIINE